MKEKSNFRKGLERILGVGIVFFGGLISSVGASTGQLEILNKLKDVGSSNGHYIVNHIETASEGYNYDDPDREYSYGPSVPSGFKTKTISKVDEKELWVDSRSFQNKYVDLGASLHSESGGSVSIISRNELECVIDPGDYGWDFGTKPITLWEQDANDPNIYCLRANVRKEVLQNGGVIPLDDLNGTYDSEIPYWKGQ